MDLTTCPTALARVRRMPEPARGAAPHPAARKIAQAFEAGFLAEMLREIGANGSPEGGRGGADEEITEEYVRLLASQEGIDFAEPIFAALPQMQDSAR